MWGLSECTSSVSRVCGIVAVLQRGSQRATPAPRDVLALIQLANRNLENLTTNEPNALHAPNASHTACLNEAASNLHKANNLLSGMAGLRLLLADKALRDAVHESLVNINRVIQRVEHPIQTSNNLDAETTNAALISLKDAAWAISTDRLQTVEAVANLTGPTPGEAALSTFWSIQVALAALDRLEIRGRDSAGIHLLVQNHGLDANDPAVAAAVKQRSQDPLFRSGSVRWAEGHLSFIYKTAAEIGELGDNTKVLRAAVGNDDLLATALANPEASAVVLGHTRWASVGQINEANAHPVNSELAEPSGPNNHPLAIAALNGDVDNHAHLKSQNSLAIHPKIITDAKVIPTLWSSRLPSNANTTDPQAALHSFRETAQQLQGSVAIAAQAATHPNYVMLALRGSGQALYVGASEDAYIVASEPYGLVEQASRYLRMDGETPATATSTTQAVPSARANPTPDHSRGQVLMLNRHEAPNLCAIQRLSYSGTPLAVTDADIATAEITTRDLDRRGHRHYLLKEINESPDSVRKTLQGRLGVATQSPQLRSSTAQASPAQASTAPTSPVQAGTAPTSTESPLAVRLSADALPTNLKQRLSSGEISNIVTIGQGTAAVAGQALAHFLRQELPQIHINSLTAAELSGFGLSSDMTNTLVVAISQSGTTTDTNRTVDLAKRRGAATLAIVNRRNSDLVSKADGALYTSDGRDVEMSVASTKAFYSQVAAGALLAVALADVLNANNPVPSVAPIANTASDGPNTPSPYRRQELLTALQNLPTQMAEVLQMHTQIAATVRRSGLGRTYWAVVGNGRNHVAAQEVRIKLSELCYKSISSDSTEDKKHIDLSSEPLILVCACGLSHSNATDVAKEVAIFRAHRAMPIVITHASQAHLYSPAEVITTPTTTSPELAFVLATMVGHLFSYESALAIDELAQPLRETRTIIQDALDDTTHRLHPNLLSTLSSALEPLAQQFLNHLHNGNYNGCLQASTATDIASLYRYSAGITPLDVYQLERGIQGTPETVLSQFLTSLGVAINELTRPIDAIRHQAKTVTVGISRR